MRAYVRACVQACPACGRADVCEGVGGGALQGHECCIEKKEKTKKGGGYYNFKASRKNALFGFECAHLEI